MNFLTKVHIYCFLLSYLVSLSCEILQMVRRSGMPARVLIVGFTTAGFVAHTAFLFARSQSVGLPPLLTSQQDWLLVLAWLGSVLYLILLLTHRELAHGLFMLPAIILLVIVAIFASDQSGGNLQAMAMRRWGMFHAASLVLGMGAVLGTSITGLMYLFHHQRLRTRSAWLKNLTLPSLENLSAWNRWMVIFSVPCLTIGLITGFLLTWWKTTGLGQTVSWTDPTIVTTVFAWLAMVILLFRLLSSAQQSGKAVAQLSLLSGGFLLITVLGPMMLAGSGNLDTFHGRPRSSSESEESPRSKSFGDGPTSPGSSAESVP